ncbi:hypothetical protein GGX14DRAFT_548025 [Mycena pura]|uniref:LysM domain-containing protein n=1 Tax=Mycena pura TaxID=153505 RepID=A0AAD6YRG0_9AGAR|nr:hypothetical protein GGX14DRAFT_548025 [Mycena pura]
MSLESNSLCLACSSSLPPKCADVFTTPCCARPICPSCVAANPRLTRYNPCLACFGGIGVVATSATGTQQAQQPATRNVDGAVRDEDTFVVGDDDEAEDGDDDLDSAARVGPATSSPVAIGSLPAPTESAPSPPSKYYIKRSDTLQGIALRFGIDGRELCRLNKLAPSTLSTTPHLLHTRSFLTFPPSAHAKLLASDPRPDSEEERAREVRRMRERAEKRMQVLTKEVDWRVAKAYIALADDPEAADAFALKQKELGVGASPGASSSSRLEAVAIDQYLDDLEWEAEQGGYKHIIPVYPSSYSPPKFPSRTICSAWCTVSRSPWNVRRAAASSASTKCESNASHEVCVPSTLSSPVARARYHQIILIPRVPRSRTTTEKGSVIPSTTATVSSPLMPGRGARVGIRHGSSSQG